MSGESANKAGTGLRPAVQGCRRRSGQTAIEYLLVTVSLLFVFVMMHSALQYAVANQFKRGGMVIMRVYIENP